MAALPAGHVAPFAAPARLRRRRRAPLVRAAAREVVGVDKQYDGTGRTVLMTGANSGIGLEASRVLVASGCRVLLAARSVDKAEAAVAECGGGEAVVLDLGEIAATRAFAKAFVASG
jgi:NADPH:quinone reductase-like Zn-dependent oxidoreductase